MLRIAQVHLVEVAREKCGFSAASPRSNFEKNVTLVVGVSGQEQDLQFLLQDLKVFRCGLDFFSGHGPDVRVRIAVQALCKGFGVCGGVIVPKRRDQRIELGILFTQGAEAILVVLGFRFCQKGGNFLKTL